MESRLKETLAIGNQEFSFELCRKQETELGRVTVDQWWMPVTALYAQRGKREERKGNHRTVLEFYWAVCRDQSAEDSREAQERYLLGSILPEMRSQGSRQIFADAVGVRGNQSQRSEEISELNRLIEQSRDRTCNEDEFQEKTWKLLGRIEFPTDWQQTYEAITSKLFDDARVHLRRGDVREAVNTARKEWSDLMRRIGRRRGHEDEKVILDVLSYEARAAVHHAYSVVWSFLLPTLHNKYGLDKPTWHFLALWHRDNVAPESVEQEVSDSLFHGHVFALHPGMSRFLLTESGCDLMGNLLQNYGEIEPLGRVLHGLFVSLYDYDQRRQETAAARRRAPRATKDMDALQEIQEERRRGHRRRGA